MVIARIAGNTLAIAMVSIRSGSVVWKRPFCAPRCMIVWEGARSLLEAVFGVRRFCAAARGLRRSGHGTHGASTFASLRAATSPETTLPLIDGMLR